MEEMNVRPEWLENELLPALLKCEESATEDGETFLLNRFTNIIEECVIFQDENGNDVDVFNK